MYALEEGQGLSEEIKLWHGPNSQRDSVCVGGSVGWIQKAHHWIFIADSLWRCNSWEKNTALLVPGTNQELHFFLV